MQNGKVVGVAFQGYSGDVAQGVAYMIPTPVIADFLKDIEDGRYDATSISGITYAKLQNPAQRRFLGLKDDDRGVLVSTVVAAGPCANKLSSRATCCWPSTITRSPAMARWSWKARASKCRKWSSENSKATR